MLSEPSTPAGILKPGSHCVHQLDIRTCTVCCVNAAVKKNNHTPCGAF